MVWKFSDGRPVYVQIMEHIQTAVLTGIFPPGSKIPSVRELAADAKVNPNTMQHALQELEQSMLLITQGTLGRFVTQDSAVIDAARNKLLNNLTQECIKKYAALSISPEQAANLLLECGKREA